MKTLISLLILVPQLTIASDQIFGGENVKNEDPIAKMTVRLGDEGTCTGSILDDDLIITAAHCTGLGTVRFGLTEEQSEARKSVGCIRHPKFVPPKIQPNRWDIALIRITGGIPKGFKAAKVLPTDVRMNIGDGAVLAGYGQDDNQQTGTLNKVSVTISHLEDYSPIEVVFDQTKGKGACYGDSGGPAFFNHNGELHLIGVTNGPYDTNDCNGHGVYAKVPAHMEWLAKAAKKLREAPVQNNPTSCIKNEEE
jgi:secreted trypsin-like serine protease